MAPLFTYVFEVSVTIALLLLVYITFFQRTTLFTLNRFYLVVGLCLAFVVPLIHVPQEMVQLHNSPLADFTFQKTIYEPIFSSHDEQAATFDLTSILTTVYVAGALLLAAKFVIGIYGINKARKTCDRGMIDGHQVYVNPILPTFSFINKIFTSSTHIDPLIIRHEHTHISQMHWVDNFLVEVASIVLWFNPLMIFYKRAVKAQHEFLADERVIALNANNLEKYLKCLLENSFNGSRYSSISSFGSHPIKTRIIMMTKNKTSIGYAFVYALIIPCLAIGLFAFTKSPMLDVSKNIITSAQDVPTEVPVDPSKIESVVDFGMRLHPVLKTMKQHTGVDFTTPAGEKVMATAKGVVIEASSDSIKGNFVTIRHGEHFVTQYFHMEKLSVKKGEEVAKGAVIGFVGNTGLSTAVHLHYEVLKDGTHVDPKNYYKLTITGK